MFTKSVTGTHGVGRCVKDGNCSLSCLEWKLVDNINGIFYYQQMSDAIKHHRWHFFLSGRQCTGAHALRVQHSPTAAVLSTSFLLNHSPPTALRWKHWLQDSGSHTAAWVWVVSQKDWRDPEVTRWIVAMHWYSIWVKNAIFMFPCLAR